MTNYCYLPAMILKELWSTEYGHSYSLANAKKNLLQQKEKCYSWLSHRVSQGHSPETEVPLFLTQCPTALPAWFGKADSREHMFQRLIADF